MKDERHDMTSGATTAAVLAHGAELCSLREGGREVVWQAGPAWPKHAPVLFPIVGALAGDRLVVDGRSYTMTKHGFARDRTFRWLHRTPNSCVLVLEDDDQTRAAFPFAFRLELAYALRRGTLAVEATVTNPGIVPLPCSLGFHPALRWPLSGADKAGHRIELSRPEEDTVAQLDTSGLIARRVPSPLADGHVVPLSDALFAHDALILDPLHSQECRYVAPDGTTVRVAWEGAAQLGLWSKPADFVCVEPWRGHADPVGFDGAFQDKPGLMHVAPGARERLCMTITV